MKELLERELGSLEEERDGLREEVEGGRGERETLQREILATRAELITAEREIERSVCVCVRSEIKLMNFKTSLYIHQVEIGPLCTHQDKHLQYYISTECAIYSMYHSAFHAPTHTQALRGVGEVAGYSGGDGERESQGGK